MALNAISFLVYNLRGAFCNTYTFDLHKATNLSLISSFCLFLSGRFTQVLLYNSFQSGNNNKGTDKTALVHTAQAGLCL